MRLAALLLLVLIPALGSGAPLSASRSGDAIGLAVAWVDQSASVLGHETSSRGALVGLQAIPQRGAAFRLSWRLLRGEVDAETDGAEATADVKLFELRNTWGMETDAGDRIYAGFGVEHVAADSSFGSADQKSWSAYVPVGITRYADWYDDWRVAVSVEGQLLLATRTELDHVPGIGDQSFTSTGGAGVLVSADFEPRDVALRVSPYVHFTATADSDTEHVHGVALQIEDQRSDELGVRVMWRF